MTQVWISAGVSYAPQREAFAEDVPNLLTAAWDALTSPCPHPLVGETSARSARATLTFTPKEPGELLRGGALSFAFASQHRPHRCGFECHGHMGVVNVWV